MTGATAQDVDVVHDLIADRDTWRVMALAALDALRGEQLRHAVTQRRYLHLLDEHRQQRQTRSAA